MLSGQENVDEEAGAPRSSTQLRSVTHGWPFSTPAISPFSTWNLLSKANLGDLQGQFLTTIKRVALFFWFPNAYKSYVTMLEKVWRKGKPPTLLVGI